jgi:hypothetical protein
MDVEDENLEGSAEEELTKKPVKPKKRQSSDKPKQVRKKRENNSNRTTVVDMKCIGCGQTGESIIFQSYHKYGLFVHFCRGCSQGLFIDKQPKDLFIELNKYLYVFKEKGYIELEIRDDKIKAYSNIKDIPSDNKKKKDVIAKEKTAEILKKEKTAEILKKLPPKKPIVEKPPVEKPKKASVEKPKKQTKNKDKTEITKKTSTKPVKKEVVNVPKKTPENPTEIVNVVDTFNVVTNTSTNLKPPLDILITITNDDTKLNKLIRKYISHESLIKDQDVICWQDINNDDDNENVFELKPKKRSEFFIYIDSHKINNKHSISGISEGNKLRLEGSIKDDKHQHMLYTQDTHCYMLNLAQNINILKWLTIHQEDLLSNDKDDLFISKEKFNSISSIDSCIKWYKGGDIPKLYISYFTIKCLSVLCHILKIVDSDIKTTNNLKDIARYYCREIDDSKDFTNLIAWDELESLINQIKIPDIPVDNVKNSYSAITDNTKRYTFDLYTDKEIYIFDEIMDLFKSKTNHDQISIPYGLTKQLLKIWKSILSLEKNETSRYGPINEKNHFKTDMSLLTKDIQNQKMRITSDRSISIDYSYSLSNTKLDRTLLEYFNAIDKIESKNNDTDLYRSYEILINGPLRILSFFKLSHIMNISNTLAIKRCIYATTMGQYNDLHLLINTMNNNIIKESDSPGLYKDKITSEWNRISTNIKFNEDFYNHDKDKFYKTMKKSTNFEKLDKEFLTIFYYIPYYLCLEYLDYYLTKTEDSKKYRLIKKINNNLITKSDNSKILKDHLSKGLPESELKYRPQFYLTINTLESLNFGKQNPSVIIYILAYMFLYLIETLPPYLKYLDTTRPYKLSSRVNIDQLTKTTKFDDNKKTLLQNLYDVPVDSLDIGTDNSIILQDFISEENIVGTFKNLKDLSDDEPYVIIGIGTYEYIRDPGHLYETEASHLLM